MSLGVKGGEELKEKIVFADTVEGDDEVEEEANNENKQNPN